jgi:hypothetical protein
VVAHYGALRGSNAYKGYDVILAQIYHPNLDAITYEGRALFADDGKRIDEQIVTTERILQDTSGERWAVQVPTFSDERLTALLENRREAEMVQCAMRGRPFDHPEAQITLMFGLPLPGLTPTIIREGEVSPASNLGRQQAVERRLIEGAKQLFSEGKRSFSVEDLAIAADTSFGTVRKYWEYIATRLRLRYGYQTRYDVLPPGGQQRVYRRMILIRRGRVVPPQPELAPRSAPPVDENLQPMDLARNKSCITRVIHRLHVPLRSFYRYKPCGRTRSTGPPG